MQQGIGDAMIAGAQHALNELHPRLVGKSARPLPQKKPLPATVPLVLPQPTAADLQDAMTSSDDDDDDAIGSNDAIITSLHPLRDAVTAFFLTEAAHQALDNQDWLTGFLQSVASSSDAQSNARAGQYAAQLTSSYEQAYGTTTMAANEALPAIDNGGQLPPVDTDDDGNELQPGEQMITWHTTAGEICELCMDRDGNQYTAATLPGWPGDGWYGELCAGGPNCKCVLTYEDATFENGLRTGGYAAERQQLAQAQSDRLAQVQDLRQQFVDSLPAASQARAQAVDDARAQVADQMGAFMPYQPTSFAPGPGEPEPDETQPRVVWPEDASTQDIADQLADSTMAATVDLGKTSVGLKPTLGECVQCHAVAVWLDDTDGGLPYPVSDCTC
jgi:hypothetical protein